MMQRVSWALVAGFCIVAAPTADVERLTQVGDRATDEPLTLEVRVFDATDEVTSQARIRVFKAGVRTAPQTVRATSGAATARVPAGFYDLQAVRERDGAVAGIRWAKQRLVQRYPDQHGDHLEVINLQSGYGALQIRHGSSPEAGTVGWRASIYRTGDATREAGESSKGDGYLLFVIPTGTYDVRVLPTSGDPLWIRDIEVPADQTQLRTWQEG